MLHFILYKSYILYDMEIKFDMIRVNISIQSWTIKGGHGKSKNTSFVAIEFWLCPFVCVFSPM